MNNIGFLAGYKEDIHEIIKMPRRITEDNLRSSLYKSIENAYRNFQVDVKKVLVNEKKENWRAVTLDYFKEVEEILRDQEIWASLTSC